jgi:hypothetical protein
VSGPEQLEKAEVREPRFFFLRARFQPLPAALGQTSEVLLLSSSISESLRSGTGGGAWKKGPKDVKGNMQQVTNESLPCSAEDKENPEKSQGGAR